MRVSLQFRCSVEGSAEKHNVTFVCRLRCDNERRSVISPTGASIPQSVEKKTYMYTDEADADCAEEELEQEHFPSTQLTKQLFSSVCVPTQNDE